MSGQGRSRTDREGDTMFTQIYLIRNAETDANVRDIFQGAGTDTDLSKKGNAQLDCLAERFREIPLDAVFYSPCIRGEKTAQAVNRYHNAPMRAEPELHEFNGGILEGKSWAYFQQNFPTYLTWRDAMQDFSVTLGEDMKEVYARMKNIIGYIEYAGRGGTVAVVSHSCALRNLLCALFYSDIRYLRYITWADCTAVSLVWYDPDRKVWRVRFRNDDSHLPEALKSMTNERWNRFDL